MLETKLNEKGIPYKKECSNFEKLMLNGITSVPVLDVDEKLLTFGEALLFIGRY